MHYYQFNIGDYASHTAHLEPMEDLAYRRLLDLYYLSEKPISLDIDEVARLIRMRSHSDCIAYVLRNFFTETTRGFINKRADKLIQEFRDKSEKAKASANERWKKNKQKQQVIGDANALRTESEGNANHKPLTINQEPVTSKKNTTGKPLVSLSSWIESTKAKGEKIIPDDDPIFEYASDAGIPDDWLRLVWIEFRTQFVENGKRQKDWRAHFRNFVRKNYYKFWWLDAGQYKLTSIGQQAMNAMNNRDKREEHEPV